MQIILADDQAIFRTGVARILLNESTLCLAAQCDDVHSLRRAVEAVQRCIVMFSWSVAIDVEMVLNWVQAAGSYAVLIAERECELEEGVRERVMGVVPRSASTFQMVDCLHAVAAGRRWERGAMRLERGNTDRVGERLVQRLTAREMQIVALIAEGYKNREIADELGTKEQVVKNYLRSIYGKAGVSDRLELALFTVHHRALSQAAAGARAALATSA
jgi:DNA-binding NarL/FixJ family response regulator